MANNSEFYRGRKKRTGPAFIISLIVLSLIAFVILLFYGLQKYISVSHDGLSLDIPLLSDGSATVVTDESGQTSKVYELVDAELVIGESDYSSVAASAGEDLEQIRSIFVPAAKVTAESVAEYVERLSDGNALTLEVKPASGQLVWSSNSDIALGYGTGGKTELASIVSSVKSGEKSVWLTAAVSCCVDDLLASRYSQLTLKDTNGAAYIGDTGAWLDPFATPLSSYLCQLCAELSAMGFDEILLTNLRQPDVQDVQFSYNSGNASPTALSAVSGLAMDIFRYMRNDDVRLSVQLTGTSVLGSGSDSLSGQDAELFFKIFDRVYCPCSVSDAATAASNAQRFITLGNADTRFVAVCTGDYPSSGCWMLKDSA